MLARARCRAAQPGTAAAAAARRRRRAARRGRRGRGAAREPAAARRRRRPAAQSGACTTLGRARALRGHIQCRRRRVRPGVARRSPQPWARRQGVRRVCALSRVAPHSKRSGCPACARAARHGAHRRLLLAGSAPCSLHQAHSRTSTLSLPCNAMQACGRQLCIWRVQITALLE